ncbi:MAG: histidine--tRNA ligase [Spirochaetes bacterium]|nr:histidine--tRNA ligase [Spirochaetota bacterium]
MSKNIHTKPPGIEDIFPDRIPLWNFILNCAKEVFKTYNFKELIIPVLEYTDVFIKGIGDDTDIVSKEMFSFEDRGGRNLCLRPEGTAGVVRAYVENGDYNRLSLSKFFYAGPMFRAEKPQKGRLRQFNQFGAETFGSNSPYYDSEIILMIDAITKRLGIATYNILINSIGCPDCRPAYIKELREYYKNNINELCEDCKKRVDRNPLRLLDCKNEKCGELKKHAPVISCFICGNCKDHHNAVKTSLDRNGVKYTEDPMLVRGLDYYTKTTFEFVSTDLGSQSAFAAGGRYDNLVETFGGKPTPAVGFAAGMERLMLLLEGRKMEHQLDVFIAYSGESAFSKALDILNTLRSRNISADIDPESGSLKSQFKKSDRENTKISIIIGEDELRENKVTIKKMQTGEQKKIEEKDIIDFISGSLN